MLTYSLSKSECVISSFMVIGIECGHKSVELLCTKGTAIPQCGYADMAPTRTSNVLIIDQKPALVFHPVCLRHWATRRYRLLPFSCVK